ncbi:MAG: hypothetical protein ACHP7N_09255 [Caulobacterales bacterium]
MLFRKLILTTALIGAALGGSAYAQGASGSPGHSGPRADFADGSVHFRGSHVGGGGGKVHPYQLVGRRVHKLSRRHHRPKPVIHGVVVNKGGHTY